MLLSQIDTQTPTLLVLYRRLPGYFYHCLKQFASDSQWKVIVIRDDPDPLAPFQLQSDRQITLLNKSKIQTKELELWISSVNIRGSFISGWADRNYLAIARKLKKKGIPTIMGMDNHWTGSFRQWLGVVASRTYLKPAFSHIWVAGIYQYEFARRLGFPSQNISTGLYSADIPTFSSSKANQNHIPKRFVYTGRLVPIKGLHLLIQAAKALDKSPFSDWTIDIYGSGPMEDLFRNIPQVNHTAFLQPEKLKEEMEKGGIFILPSLDEPWGVVVHEFAAAGYPMILSDSVGAKSSFLTHGYNGYQFKSGDFEGMFNVMKTMISHSEEEVIEMGNRSKQLSLTITPSSWSATLNSIVNP